MRLSSRHMRKETGDSRPPSMLCPFTSWTSALMFPSAHHGPWWSVWPWSTSITTLKDSAVGTGWKFPGRGCCLWVFVGGGILFDFMSDTFLVLILSCQPFDCLYLFWGKLVGNRWQTVGNCWATFLLLSTEQLGCSQNESLVKLSATL